MRTHPLSQTSMAGTWALVLFSWIVIRAWLMTVYNQPLMGPGGWVVLVLLVVMMPLVLDPPDVASGVGKKLAGSLLGTVLAVVGLQMLWTRFFAAQTWLLPGLVLIILGSAVLCAILWKDRQAGPLLARAGRPLALKYELGLFVLVLLVATGFRFYKLSEIPGNWWFDEVNLTMRTMVDVYNSGQAPLYIGQMIENPGLYLHVGAAAFKFLGISIETYRQLSAFFGVLGCIMFYFLAREWFGPRWAWAAMLVFASMRWALVPQRMAFMSAFALFWLIGSVAFFWRALRCGGWNWAAAGFFAGVGLHCYTPSRGLLPMLALFSLISFPFVASRAGVRGFGLFLLGLLIPAGFIAYAMTVQWDLFWKRPGEVSIMADIKSQGLVALWHSIKNHLLMFHFRGDHNGRHNLSFWPSVDFSVGLVLTPAILWIHLRFIADLRARLLVIWFWAMMAMGILSVLVEAPQAHRTVLVVPALVLAMALFSQDFVIALARWLPGKNRARLLPAALVFLLSIPVFNAYEYFDRWANNADVWRSFSPVSSGVVRRMQAQPDNWSIYHSMLENEYQFHGFELEFFTKWFLRNSGKRMGELKRSTSIPRDSDLGVLAIWGDSDGEIRAAAKAQFPDIEIERKYSVYSSEAVYEAMQIPRERLPLLERPEIEKNPPFLYIEAAKPR